MPPAKPFRFSRMNRLLLVVLTLLLSACQILPDLSRRSTSSYLDLPASPQLQNALLPTGTLPAEGALSDIYLLDDPHNAFVARAALIQSAQKTLDIQYYIWHNDISGKLLIQMLRQAAQRGVRVRLLLDDNNTPGLDNLLALLNREPNIEVRLFNPFANRNFRALGYLTDFPRLNRRMHNKALTADNQATILGGRNIGDEYFNVTTDTGFADLDILALGPLVGEVSADFDRYWASGSSYPFEWIVLQADADKGLRELEQAKTEKQAVLASYRRELQHSDLFSDIRANRIPWIRAPAHLISDDPAKGLARDKHKPDIISRINEALQSPKRELYIVSPYFVPTKPGLQALSLLSERGVRITVLTNSLQATDVAAVHSGYARYRRDLLKSGIRLYELKATQAVPKVKDRGLTGSSATSLHAKTFVVDRERVFIGSLNFDPRSVRLNTEMGVVIESAPLANAMQTSLEETVPLYAYTVTLDDKQRLQWQDPENGAVSRKEPQARFWKRVAAKLLSFLPIEGLL